jgi:hypothetical protein
VERERRCTDYALHVVTSSPHPARSLRWPFGVSGDGETVIDDFYAST